VLASTERINPQFIVGVRHMNWEHNSQVIFLDNKSKHWTS